MKQQALATPNYVAFLPKYCARCEYRGLLQYLVFSCVVILNNICMKFSEIRNSKMFIEMIYNIISRCYHNLSKIWSNKCGIDIAIWLNLSFFLKLSLNSNILLNQQLFNQLQLLHAYWSYITRNGGIALRDNQHNIQISKDISKQVQ